MDRPPTAAVLNHRPHRHHAEILKPHPRYRPSAARISAQSSSSFRFLRCDFGDDLLRQHIELLEEAAGRLAAAHAVEQRRALDELVATAGRGGPWGAGGRMSRTPDALQEGLRDQTPASRAGTP